MVPQTVTIKQGVINVVLKRDAKALDEVVGMLTDKREAAKVLRTVVTILLNDEADRKKREGYELKHYTEQEVGWLITQENVSEVLLTVLRAYGLSLPEPDEFESPNVTSGQTG